MTKYPLVSLVIPVYNESRYLNDCLSTLINQTYSPLEIIVVDDGSTDNSVQISRSYHVKIIKQNHLGLGSARNNGARHSRGSILVFPDADMRFDPDYVKYLVGDIISGKTIGTFTTGEFVANPNNVWSCCWSFNAGLPPHRRLPENFGPTDGAFRAIKKDIFLKYGGLDASGFYTDDATFSKKSKILATVVSKAVCYHHNPESLMEVFHSTRWMGRSPLFPKSLANFFRYSPFNSLRVSFKYILNGAPWQMIPFKLVYDAGTFAGIFLSGNRAVK